MANKHFQFLRSSHLYASLGAAKNAISVLTLLPGEPAIAYYPSGDGAEAQAVLAIGAKDASDSNKAKVFFYDQKEIKSIIDALDATNISYTSGATDVIVNESETVDEAVKALDAAVAKIKNGDKTYKLVPVSASGETVKEEYELHVKTATGEWAKAEGSANIKIYKDSSIVSIDYVTKDGSGKAGQFLKYTYINAEFEEQTSYIDISNVVIESEFKNGLQVTDGKVSVKIDSESAGNENFLSVSDKGVKISGVQDAIDTTVEAEIGKLDADFTSDNAVASTDGHVTVGVKEENGVITSLTVATNDIASAALLGTISDNKDNRTAFGFIAKESADRAAAINNLNVSDNTSGAVAGVTVTVNETAGLVQKPVVSVANNTVTYTAASGDTAANLVVADETAVIKGEAIAKIKSYIDAKTGAGIDALDAVVSATTDYVNYSVTETDGKLTAATLNVTVQAVAGASASAKGLAEASDVKTYVDNAINALDKADTAVGHQFVTAVSEKNGVITVSRAQATAADIASTAINDANDTVAIAGTNVKTQIENIGKAIKATYVKNKLSSTSNALSVDVKESGTTIKFNISTDAVTQDMLSVANDGLKIADTWDCGTF